MSNLNPQSNALQMVVMNDHRFAVRQRPDGKIEFNLTLMSKPYGRKKRPSSWLRTESAQEYLEAITVAHKCATADLVEVRQGGLPGNQGTWCLDHRIAVRFAQWLDPRYAVTVDEIIWQLLTKQMAVVKPFKDVWPLVIEGVAYYYYMDVLRSLGRSTRSGSVYKKPKQYPQLFKKLYGRQFCKLEMCEILQDEAMLQARKLAAMSNQLNLPI